MRMDNPMELLNREPLGIISRESLQKRIDFTIDDDRKINSMENKEYEKPICLGIRS